MALQSSRQNVLVRIAEWHERRWATGCDGALCVSKAMQQDLARNWGVQATVFYDRPPSFFKRATVEETNDLMLKLAPVFMKPMHPNDFLTKLARHDDDIQNSSKKQGAAATGTATTATPTTICTTKEENGSSSKPIIKLRDNRPAIFVSSTSWTPDEDFGILLQAAIIYDTLVKTTNNQRQHNAPPNLPNLVILVTGKGPQKESYEQQMASTNLDHVAFRTLWLEPADYPILLGSADLGVSLHSSSSGVDLPMKVVDMLGCNLPVCALSYSCISELVADGKNGLLFGGAEELATQWVELMRGGEGGGWPKSVPLLERLRKGAEVGGSVKWRESWERIARNVILNNNNSGSERRGGERGRVAA